MSLEESSEGRRGWFVVDNCLRWGNRRAILTGRTGVREAALWVLTVQETVPVIVLAVTTPGLQLYGAVWSSPVVETVTGPEVSSLHTLTVIWARAGQGAAVQCAVSSTPAWVTGTLTSLTVTMQRTPGVTLSPPAVISCPAWRTLAPASYTVSSLPTLRVTGGSKTCTRLSSQYYSQPLA